jgi:hypothetical protein
MPPDLKKPTDNVEGIGEPTNACFLIGNDIDPTGWFFFSSSFLFCLFYFILFYLFICFI